MEPLSRAEIESSVDSFPDLDYKFEHIDWADIMDAEEGSNPEQKLENLKQRSSVINSSLYVNPNPVSLSAMPALTSLRLDDHSRGLPPLQPGQKSDKRSGPVPTSFSGVLNSRNPRLEPSPNNTSPSNSSRGVFKVPAPPKQAGRPLLEGLKPLDTKDRKSSTLRPPPSPSSIHEKKRQKISNNSFSKDWDYVDDDFIFTTDTDITPTNFNSFRLPIPHSASVSTLESDTEIETGSAYSETSSTSTLTSKESKRRENLPKVEDPKKLEQRQKQIDYGKNTEGYINYSRLYPKVNRPRDMPKTPDKTIGYSHRRWLGLLTKWRKSLHQFDREGAPQNTPPKSENIPIHLEDANTFPTLPLKLENDGVKSENMDEGYATPFSYSLVLQNLHEKTDPPIIPSPHRDTILQQACFERSEREVQVGVTDRTPVVSTEGTATGYMSYSAVLRASKPIRIEPPQPVVAPYPGTVKEEPKEIEEIREEIPSEIPLDIQENIPSPSKPTYCQVLMAPKSINPITSPPILGENLKEPIPLPPEETPLPQDSDSDDSMEVDSPPINTTSVVEPTRQVVVQDPLQPLTYSQALRSNPPLPIFNANTTADKEHLRERNNELIGCKTLPNEDRVVSNLNEDIVPKENEPCPDPPSEQAPLTYSQVLSGIRSPLASEPTTDRDIGTESEDASPNAQISESAHSVHSPPPPKSYRYLIPQSTTVSIQEQS